MNGAIGGRRCFGPFDRQQPWARWWVWLWGVVSVGLLAGVCFRAPFMAWALAALVLFGGMEAWGLHRADDAYPPLTQVIREYVPRWVAFTLIYAGTGMAAGTWFRFAHRWELTVLAGLLGWFTAHFDLAFDRPAALEEAAKYAWYARRLGFRGVSTRLEARLRPGESPSE